MSRLVIDYLLQTSAKICSTLIHFHKIHSTNVTSSANVSTRFLDNRNDINNETAQLGLINQSEKYIDNCFRLEIEWRLK